MKRSKQFIWAMAITIPMSLWAHDHDTTSRPQSLAQNNCDRLLSPTTEDLDRCFARFGKSPYRLDMERRLAAEERDVRAEADRILNERAQLESHTFTREELDDNFFGQQVIIVRVDRNDASKQEVTFDPNRVCRYLGYNQATDVRVGGLNAEIWSDDTDSVRGVVLKQDLSFEAYRDSGFLNTGLFRSAHLVKPLESITCFRTRDGSTAPLRHLPDLIVMTNERVNRAPRENDLHIDQSSRRNNSSYAPFTSGITNPAHPTGSTGR